MFSSVPYRHIAHVALMLTVVTAVACAPTQPSAPPTATPSPSTNPAPSATAAASVPPSATQTPLPTQSATGAALLLEVTQEGGFIAPSAQLGTLPTVVVDTAGDIYSQGAAPAGGAFIEPVVVRDVGPSGALQILAAMRAAGLDKASSQGGVGNPDAGATVFTAEIDGQEVVNRVVAQPPGGGIGRPGASPNPATSLLERLLDETETWGATNVTTTLFTPSAYKIYTAPTTTQSGSTASWPLSQPLNAFGTPATPNFGVTGLRTGAVLGPDATTIADAFRNAAPDAVVSSDGGTYQVWVRPLLPPEIN